mmetsp:Transcript_65063/g.187218  ORF Transcript_65063/g.187218 Transcript_65063/m.187218 type:complete len:206 (-) Transcript_65063:1445-2062(-)
MDVGVVRVPKSLRPASGPRGEEHSGRCLGLQPLRCGRQLRRRRAGHALPRHIFEAGHLGAEHKRRIRGLDHVLEQCRGHGLVQHQRASAGLHHAQASCERGLRVAGQPDGDDGLRTGDVPREHRRHLVRQGLHLAVGPHLSAASYLQARMRWVFLRSALEDLMHKLCALQVPGVDEFRHVAADEHAVRLQLRPPKCRNNLLPVVC